MVHFKGTMQLSLIMSGSHANMVASHAGRHCAFAALALPLRGVAAST